MKHAEQLRKLADGLEQVFGFGMAEAVRQLRAAADELDRLTKARRALPQRDFSLPDKLTVSQLIQEVRRMADLVGFDGSFEDGNEVIWQVADELDRLSKLEASLPRTADGVPVVPGMSVWTVREGLASGMMGGGKSTFPAFPGKVGWHSTAQSALTAEAARKAADET